MSIALPVTHAPVGAGNSSRCFTMYTPVYPVTHALSGGEQLTLLHNVYSRVSRNTCPVGAGEQLRCSTMYAKWETAVRQPSRKMYEQLVTAYPEIKI